MPTPTPVPPTGNSATWLNDISGVSSKTLNTVSDLLGAVADITAVVGVVLAVVGAVETALGQKSETELALEAVLNSIQQNFHQLNADEAANQILSRNQTLNQLLATPLAHFSSLPSALPPNPPFSAEYRNQQIQDCITALNSLTGINAPSLIWNLDYDWQIFFNDIGAQTTIKWVLTSYAGQGYGSPGGANWVASVFDVGYGSLAPGKNTNGSVFAYNYALPSYMMAVAAFIAVGSALDPAFATNYKSQLDTCIAVLQQVHDLITYQGIHILFPAPWINGQWIIATTRAGARGCKDLNPSQPDYDWVDHGGPSQYDGCFLYFGAVELYSGASVTTADYKVFINLLPGNDQSANSRTGVWNKAQLKARALAKQLYHNVGMPSVANAIDTVKRVRDGQAPRSARFGDWSFRQDILPTMQIAITGNHYSMRAVANSLRSYPPADPAGQLSFRQLLSVP